MPDELTMGLTASMLTLMPSCPSDGNLLHTVSKLNGIKVLALVLPPTLTALFAQTTRTEDPTAHVRAPPPLENVPGAGCCCPGCSVGC